MASTHHFEIELTLATLEQRRIEHYLGTSSTRPLPGHLIDTHKNLAADLLNSDPQRGLAETGQLLELLRAQQRCASPRTLAILEKPDVLPSQGDVLVDRVPALGGATGAHAQGPYQGLGGCRSARSARQPDRTGVLLVRIQGFEYPPAGHESQPVLSGQLVPKSLSGTA